ncbi:hypothetical protein Slin15195_G095230 [Septoria linicola]|uniref:SnoaL-like domain-containing protein n=1 Tax=Septoria linicola TaxID=215465 RepID=A0A9Q9EN54_9PEZI|nr:hypothetical protein Slin15195_G095230 [Septoria linicola]
MQSSSKTFAYIQPASDSTDTDVPNHLPSDSTSDLGSRLEALSQTNVAIINARDWSLETPEAQALVPCISPDFRTWMHNLSKPMTLSFQDATDIISKIVEENPSYHEEVLAVSSDVDEKKGKAIVTMHVRVYGHGEEGSVVEAVREARWKREGGVEHGKWWLYEYVGVRGISMDAGVI